MRSAPFHLRQLSLPTATFAPDLPAHVEGDEAKLRQVLFNLLGNALKFTERGSVALRVARTAGSDHRQVRFEVIDTGVGIAPDDLERIFEPFHQGRRNPLGAPGTGLGLAISRHMVELMGGTIRVESAPGRGIRCSFELPLPLAVDATGRTRRTRRAAAAPRQRSRAPARPRASRRHPQFPHAAQCGRDAASRLRIHHRAPPSSRGGVLARRFASRAWPRAGTRSRGASSS